MTENAADRLEAAEKVLAKTSDEIRALMERLESETEAYNQAVRDAAKELVEKVKSCDCDKPGIVLWLQQAKAWLEDDFLINYHNPGWNDPPVTASELYRFMESME